MTATAFAVPVSPPKAARRLAERFHSVAFRPETLGTLYQSRIWELVPDGPCILFKPTSEVLPHLMVGQTLAMNYYPVDRSRPDTMVLTRIRHITPKHRGRFKGHVLVGLAPVPDAPEKGRAGEW